MPRFIPHALATALLASSLMAPATSHAADTVVEMQGLLMYLDGMRVTATGLVFEEVLYDSATGGTALERFGPTYVSATNGNFYHLLQPVDDSLLAGPTFVALTVNGFDMTSRLQVLSYQGRYWVEGYAQQDNLFKVYTGYAAAQAVPEPATHAMLLTGVAALLAATWRRRKGL